MTWKHMALLFLLGFLIACAPVAVVPVSGPADTPVEKPILLPISTLAPSGSSSALAGSDPNASSLAPSGSDALLPGLSALVDQRRADLLSGPGWLHLVTRRSGSNNGLSNLWGQVPETWQEEEWLELDTSGRVKRAARRLLDENLHPLQSSVLVGNAWWNLTLGAQTPAEDEISFDPHYGYYTRVLRLAGEGRALSTSTIYKECWYIGEQYSIGDGTFKYEAVFNPDNHSLRWLKTWQVSPGPLVLVESREILVEDRVDQPPPEILALFGKQY